MIIEKIVYIVKVIFSYLITKTKTFVSSEEEGVFSLVKFPLDEELSRSTRIGGRRKKKRKNEIAFKFYSRNPSKIYEKK